MGTYLPLFWNGVLGLGSGWVMIDDSARPELYKSRCNRYTSYLQRRPHQPSHYSLYYRCYTHALLRRAF